MNQRLGTLLEHLEPSIPIITVEFGGFMDPNADWLARESLHKYIVTNHLTQMLSRLMGGQFDLIVVRRAWSLLQSL